MCYNNTMKILVIGDTHGKLNMVRDIMSKLKGIDLIIHTGDHYRDGAALNEEYHIPVVAVRGNCDASGGEDFQVIETEAGKILLTHGHKLGVKHDLTRLLYKAQEEGCIAAVYGHTHVSLVDEIDGLKIINPGSLPFSRDGSSGSYAVIRTGKNRLDASVVYCSTVMRGAGKSLMLHLALIPDIICSRIKHRGKRKNK